MTRKRVGAINDALGAGLALARAVAVDDDEEAAILLYDADFGPLAWFLADAILTMATDRTRTLCALGDLDYPGRDLGLELCVSILAGNDTPIRKLLPMIDANTCRWLAYALVLVLACRGNAVQQLDEAARVHGHRDALNRAAAMSARRSAK
jgi:hypothetical protein